MDRALQAVAAGKDPIPCYPQGRYMTASQFETAMPCQIQKS
jgi:hypothetical protein